MIDIYRSQKKRLVTWFTSHFLTIFVYQTIIMVLVFLHSLGYFHPYFPINAQFIINVALILAVLLLKARSTHIYIISAIFLFSALTLKIIGISIWAERASIYVYESFCIGTAVFLYEVTILVIRMWNLNKRIVKILPIINSIKP